MTKNEWERGKMCKEKNGRKRDRKMDRNKREEIKKMLLDTDRDRNIDLLGKKTVYFLSDTYCCWTQNEGKSRPPPLIIVWFWLPFGVETKSMKAFFEAAAPGFQDGRERESSSSASFDFFWFAWLSFENDRGREWVISVLNFIFAFSRMRWYTDRSN